MRKLNAAWVCHDGRFVERTGLPAPLPHGAHPKTLHPNYRFFDDDRHFYSLRKIAGETGTRVTDWMIPYELPAGSGTVRLGVQLCEDVWHQDYRDRHESLDTLRAWHRARGGPGDQPVRVTVDVAEERQAPPRGARGDGPRAGTLLLRQPGGRPEQREERPGVRRGHLRIPHRRLARGPGAALARDAAGVRRTRRGRGRRAEGAGSRGGANAAGGTGGPGGTRGKRRSGWSKRRSKRSTTRSSPGSGTSITSAGGTTVTSSV